MLTSLQMYDWMDQSPLMQVNGDSLIVWDNTDTNNNCTDVDHFLWTYNSGTMIMGSAYMYNYVSKSLLHESCVS